MRTPRTLGRLERLLRRREVQVVAGLWVLATVIACFFHATGRLGYPSALFANVLVGLLGPWIGVAAARVEQDLANARAAAPGLPSGLREAGGPLRAALLPVVVSGGVVAALVAITYATAWVYGDLGWRDPVPLATAQYVLMVLPSVPAAVTLGVVAGALSRRRLVVGLALPAFLAASVAVSLWPFLTGPQLGIYNHLLGLVPALADPSGLIPFRALTLAWAGLGVALLGLTVDTRFRLARPQVRWRRLPAAILTVAAVWAVGTLELHGSLHGFDVSPAEAARRLGPTVRSAHFVIHLPAGLSRRQMEQVVARHERAYARVLAYLHLPDGTAAPITSWVLNGPAADLLGFATMIPAKPWRREIYVFTDVRPGEENVYEQRHVGRAVAYVVLGTLGRGPLRVSTAGGLLPDHGLETGLALAATAGWDTPDAYSEMAPDRRAEALRATGLARDPRRQFSIRGLLSGTRNDEALDGSFVSWLVATRGVAAVERAFHAGDLRVLGDPQALFRAWGAALDRRPPTVAERRLVEQEALLDDGSDGSGDCTDPPRQVTDLDTTLDCAHEALEAGRPQVAAAWIRRSLVVEPELPGVRVADLRTLLDQDRPREALQRLTDLVEDPKVDPAYAAGKLDTEGDRLWRAGKHDEAAACYQMAQDADPCAGSGDMAIKLALILDPRFTGRPKLALRATHDHPRAVRAFLAAAPGSAVAEYLLGRTLVEAHPAAALPHLEHALALQRAAFPDLRRRIYLDLARARWGTGDDAGAVAAWKHEASYPDCPGLWGRYHRWEAARVRRMAAFRASHPHWTPDVVTPR